MFDELVTTFEQPCSIWDVVYLPAFANADVRTRALHWLENLSTDHAIWSDIAPSLMNSMIKSTNACPHGISGPSEREKWLDGLILKALESPEEIAIPLFWTSQAHPQHQIQSTNTQAGGAPTRSILHQLCEKLKSHITIAVVLHAQMSMFGSASLFENLARGRLHRGMDFDTAILELEGQIGELPFRLPWGEAAYTLNPDGCKLQACDETEGSVLLEFGSPPARISAIDDEDDSAAQPADQDPYRILYRFGYSTHHEQVAMIVAESMDQLWLESGLGLSIQTYR